MTFNGINTLTYYTINILSVIIGIIYININLKKEIKKNKKILLFNIIYILFAIIFGKLYTYILYKKTTLSTYGGLIGTILSAYIFEKIIPLNKRIIKLTILSLPLVYSTSKISCLLAGCCQGFIYTGPLALKYPNLTNDSYFPIQLIEIISFFILFLYSNKNNIKKNITFVTLYSISIIKFLLDYLRINHSGILLSYNQIFSIILLITTIYIQKKLIKKISFRLLTKGYYYK